MALDLCLEHNTGQEISPAPFFFPVHFADAFFVHFADAFFEGQVVAMTIIPIPTAESDTPTMLRVFQVVRPAGGS